ECANELRFAASGDSDIDSCQVPENGVLEVPISINADVEVNNHTSVARKRKYKLETIEPGSMNVISAKYESLDYDVCENNLLLEEDRTKGYKFVVKKNLSRWLIFLLIGTLTAFIACIIDIGIEELSEIKFKTLKKYVDRCVEENCLYIPFLIWVVTNIVPVALGSALVAYIEPTAAGSGIPQVKCYLNGVKVPRVVRIKTLFVKVVGVICSVVGGLAVGKVRNLRIFKYFREDHEKRDFVSGGAAAGVAAAFGAPVGGVLFSLEEGASFWNQSLTWRIFFASIVSTFTLNIVLSTYHGHPGELSYAGLLNFGKFDNISYELFELPIFVLMGVIGGLLGSIFNHINYKLTVFRMRNITKKWMSVLEAMIVAAISATLGFLMIYFLNDCKPLGQDPTTNPIQMFCGDGEYNAVAAIWFQTPEASVRSLFHDPPGSHKSRFSWCVFCLLLFAVLLDVWTESLFPSSTWVDPGKYALVGAAAQLGGVVRMTISLTVIMIEATGNITFGLPLMLTLIMAKWIGDFFNEGLYDIHIQLSGVPLLPWEPPPLSYNIYASEIMSHPVFTFNSVEYVGYIVDVLKSETYNGFPGDTGDMKRTFRGIILRSQLIVLIKNKIFNESSDIWNIKQITIKMFRDEYPRYPNIKDVNVTNIERSYTIDLRPFMNPSPYTVQHSASLPRVFRLFRALGLRHLAVVNDTNEVIGIVTRKDLARYRIWRHRGQMGMEELVISEKV
ncbi:hypothetical protein L9F63_023078, partial [Diploptera punctata]